MFRSSAALLAALAALIAIPAAAGSLPFVPGTCAETSISFLGQRLTEGANGPPIAGSGSAVGFANGGYQVSYDEIQAINLARLNDPVVICLERIALDRNGEAIPRGERQARESARSNEAERVQPS